jgi:ABC-2 type transport system ATP-binding protein
LEPFGSKSSVRPPEGEPGPAPEALAAASGERGVSRPTEPERVPILELRGVAKRYGSFTAVKAIDLTVHPGEILAFLGPNGAGKTTTIRMVAGTLRPSAGQIFIGGDDLALTPELAKQRIGYVPDRPFLYEKLSGSEFLRFVAGLWGMDGKVVDERAERFLRLFSLSDWADELIESYSHGMRQKLLISAAFLHDPELVVVDEPMVGLDPRSARLLKDLLRAFVDRGGAVFLSTHTLEVAEAVSDRIAIISEGGIIALGTMEELRAQADAGEAHLEEIFLKVTGGDEVADLVRGLRGVLEG